MTYKEPKWHKEWRKNLSQAMKRYYKHRLNSKSQTKHKGEKAKN